MYREHRRRPSHLVTAALAVAALLLSACGGGGEQAATDSAVGASALATAQQTAAGPASGEQLYQRCATCHQPNGKGMTGVYPPLAGSEYVTAANPAAPIRVVLRGLQGPITVAGAPFSGAMPAYGTGIEMTDAEVAAVVTHIRQAWGNGASAVTAEQVAAERAKVGAAPLTAEELKLLL
ncbi:MAG TPA: cytochrome c [Gemmatimonadaceae bacterium]|nr:cytochrome c [Gemmatimonadaceae bacterium]